MQLNIKFWLKFSLLNLSIVALLGVLMRYNIGFEFPFLDQKHIQHSHSHFAFAGWITHTLFVLMIYFLQTKIIDFRGNHYKKVLIANLICSYGMLFSFIIQGYAFISITFSTSSIFISYYFCYLFFKDLKLLKTDSITKNWFKAALFFNVLSSVGTFYLAFMMITKNVIQDLYLSSIYFYLHFQYNGWFFFGCMGLLYGFLNLQKSEHPFYNTSFKLFAASCIPAYLLSILWFKLPVWLYLIAIISGIIQVYSWFKLVLILIKTRKNSLKKWKTALKYIFLFAGLALSLKLVLQLAITIPSIGKWAYGFRPIVIAYLHLVLLAVFSLFLLFYIYSHHLFTVTPKVKLALLLFAIGVLFNEILLASQGLAAIGYIQIPYINGLLFAAAVVLFIGISSLSYFSFKKS
jgi:hypothetical protein